MTEQKPEHQYIKQYKKLRSIVWSALSSLLTVSMGLLLAFAGFYLIFEPTDNYQPIQAEILYSRVSSKSGAADSSSRGLWTTYLGLYYRYQVDGKTYHGMGTLNIGSNKTRSKIDTLEQSAKYRYRKGQLLEVYYKPDKPEKNSVKQRTPWIGIPVALLGVLFILSGIVPPFYDWLNKRNLNK